MIVNFSNTFPYVNVIGCYHPDYKISILYYSNRYDTGIERTKYQFDPKNTSYYISVSRRFIRPCYIDIIDPGITEIVAHNIPEYNGISTCSEFNLLTFSELWL